MQLEESANVKKMITFLAHRYTRVWKALNNDNEEVYESLDLTRRRPVAWNGQVQNIVDDVVQSHSCLADYDTIPDWDLRGDCEGINVDMSLMGTGESTGSCGANGSPAKRDDGGSCPLDPVGDSGSGGVSISFTSGATAVPTCTQAGGCGGTVCTGYYCTPSPTDMPPDFWDPEDPNNGSPRTTTSIPSTAVTSSSSTSSSSTTMPTPQPSQAVWINFDFEIVMDEFGEPAAFGSSWKWFEVTVGQGLEVCQMNAVYGKSSGNGLKNPGWPPSMDSRKDVWGRSGYHYEGNSKGAGQLQCDGVPRFQCDVDPQSDQQLDCADLTGLFSDDTFVPRVRCTIPAV
ncbi:hypothetical protein F4678DRAFT_20719 [Xylaria arbuscula]|nr:hypothetical protein F4678DRAFT_20719 [Xylaria arbuscula]